MLRRVMAGALVISDSVTLDVTPLARLCEGHLGGAVG
jgi:hypothetical protein